PHTAYCLLFRPTASRPDHYATRPIHPLPNACCFFPNDRLPTNLQNRLVGKHSADLPLINHPHERDPTTNDRHAVAPFQDSPPTLESLFPHLDEVILPVRIPNRESTGRDCQPGWRQKYLCCTG